MVFKKNRNAEFEREAVPLLPALFRHACWLTRNPSEAEDIVQEALAKALRAFDSFQTGSNFKAWIFRILRNVFLTSRTAIATANTVSLDEHLDGAELPDDRSTPEAEILRLDDAAALHAALEALPLHLREAVLLCDVEEMKYREIAVVLQLPIGTVMSRISRARAALRTTLQTHFGETR